MKVLLVVTAIALAVLAVPGSSIAGVGRVAKPVSGGTLTIGIANEVASLDPIRGSVGGLTTGSDRSNLVFGTLLTLNTKTGAVTSGMAESINSTDAQTWTLKLRPNLKFTDGTPYDAAAVVFNIQRLQDPANVFTGISTVSQITKMTAVDPVTVEFKLIQPNGSFPSSLTDVVGQVASPTAIKADPRNWGQKPVGAGAYIMKEWTRDRQYTFVRNPDYWDKPRPYIDTIVFRIIPTHQLLAASLKAGDIDMVNVAEASTDLQVALQDPKNFRGFDPVNLSASTGMVCNIAVSPCSDIRFREALSLAFDFKSAKSVNIPTVPYAPNTYRCAPFGPASPYCAHEITTKYNPQKARKLIDAVKADGLDTNIVYTWNFQSAAGPASGEWAQQALKAIGVNATLRSVTSNEYVTILNRHDFQLAINSAPSAPDPTVRYYNDFHSVGGPNGGRDIANLNNARLDVALEKGRNALKFTDRIAGIQEAQKIINAEHLVVWHFPLITGVVSKRTLQLPNYVSADAPLYRLEAAWVKGGK